MTNTEATTTSESVDGPPDDPELVESIDPSPGEHSPGGPRTPDSIEDPESEPALVGEFGRRGFMKRAAVAAAATSTIGGAAMKSDRLSPVGEADALPGLTTAGVIVVSVAFAAGAAIGAYAAKNYLDSEAEQELDDQQDELRQLNDEDTALRIAELADAMGTQEQEFVIGREKSFNFEADLSGGSTAITSTGNPNTTDFVDLAWSEIRAGAGSEFAAGGSANDAIRVARNRTEKVVLSSTVSLVEHARANFEALAYIAPEQADNSNVSTLRIGSDSVEPVPAGGRPAGTDEIAAGPDSGDPVMISVPVQPVDGFPAFEDLPELGQDYEMSIPHIYDGSSWIPAISIDHLPIEYGPDVSSSTLSSTAKTVYAKHPDLDGPAHPHVGIAFDECGAQLGAAYAQLADPEIPDFCNAAESQITEGELDPAELIGGRALARRYADTSNFSRFAAALVASGMRIPGESALGTEAKVEHSALSRVSIEITGSNTGYPDPSGRPAVNSDGSKAYNAVPTTDSNANDVLDIVEIDLNDFAVSQIARISGIFYEPVVWLTEDESGVVATDGDTIVTANISDGSTTSNAFGPAVNNEVRASYDYDAGRDLVYAADDTGDNIEVIDPANGSGVATLTDSTAASISAIDYDASLDVIVAGRSGPLLSWQSAGTTDGSQKTIDLTSTEFAHDSDSNSSSIQNVNAIGGTVDLMRIDSTNDYAAYDRIDYENSVLDARIDQRDIEIKIAGNDPRDIERDTETGTGVFVLSAVDAAIALDPEVGELSARYDMSTTTSSSNIYAQNGIEIYDKQLSDGETETRILVSGQNHDDEFNPGGVYTGDDEVYGHLFIDTDSSKAIQEGTEFGSSEYEEAYLLTDRDADDNESVLMTPEEDSLIVLEVEASQSTKNTAGDAEQASDNQVDEDTGDGLDANATPSDNDDVDEQYYIAAPGDDETLSELQDKGNVLVQVEDVSTGDVVENRAASELVETEINGSETWALPVSSDYSDVRLEYGAGFTTEQPVEPERDPSNPDEIKQQVEKIQEAEKDIEEARQDIVAAAAGGGSGGGGIGQQGIVAGGILAAILAWLFGGS